MRTPRSLTRAYACRLALDGDRATLLRLREQLQTLRGAPQHAALHHQPTEAFQASSPTDERRTLAWQPAGDRSASAYAQAERAGAVDERKSEGGGDGGAPARGGDAAAPEDSVSEMPTWVERQPASKAVAVLVERRKELLESGLYDADHEVVRELTRQIRMAEHAEGSE